MYLDKGVSKPPLTVNLFISTDLCVLKTRSPTLTEIIGFVYPKAVCMHIACVCVRSSPRIGLVGVC